MKKIILFLILVLASVFATFISLHCLAPKNSIDVSNSRFYSQKAAINGEIYYIKGDGVYKAAENQIKLLTGFADHYIPDPIQKVYLNMPLEKQNLIKPYVPTNEQFAQQWVSQKYTGLKFNQDAAVFLTESGEKVRSKSEKMIADKLALMGIPYRYECPLRLNNTTVYPDFTLLNVKTRKVVYYEHFGMMDDPVYCDRAIKKLHDYQTNGFSFNTNLIVTFETKSQPLDLRVVEKMIKNAFASMEA